ncbi:MAG: c-type cytochrome [Chloroflexi bacterium]|nr:c-type cytochrome [Chloroflexota bacterium]
MPTKHSAILIAVFFFIAFVLVGQTISAPSAIPAATKVAATPEATIEPTSEATAELAQANPEADLIGDAQRGQEIFDNGLVGAPACKSCHLTTAGHSMFTIAPNLQGIAERAATRIPGMTALQYIEDSIRNPADYLVSGFHVAMYPNFGTDYTDQDVADLIAYLLTL